MRKNILQIFSSLALVGFVLVACSKEQAPKNHETLQERTNESLGLSLSVNLEDLQEGEEETRLMSYDLSSDNKPFKINLLHIKNASTDELATKGVQASDVGKIPVHLFFMTKSGGTSTRVYKQVLMDITGEKTLKLPFTEFADVRSKFTTSNANDWYVKGFIGGTPLKKSGNNYNEAVGADVDAISFCTDFIFDITSSTTKYITRTSYVTTPTQGARWDRVDFPYPMETPWTKVQFYFKDGKSDGSNPADRRDEYPNSTQAISFRPLGSIMRIKIENTTSRTYQFQVLDFSPTTRKKEDQVYVNNIVREINKSITDASTSDTNDGVLEGATTNNQYSGDCVYQSVGVNKNTARVLGLAPNETRYFCFWIMRNSAVSKSSQQVKPFIHNDPTDRNGLSNSSNEAVKSSAIWLTSSKNNGFAISADKYQAGRSYLIQTTLRNKTR